jgi:predicted nucleic acid-binding Zn ribbon protein
MERAGRLIGRLQVGASTADLARAAWPAAVGQRIAAHAVAVAMEGSCLVVEVEDSVWKGHLVTLRHQILHRLDEVMGPGHVRSLEFRSMIPRRQPAREERSARPFDEADTIADPALRHIYKVARRKATA